MATFLALVHPGDQRQPVFPFLETGVWGFSRALWMLVGLVAAGHAAASVAGGGATRRLLASTGGSCRFHLEGGMP